ncbi:hypothetical protein PHISP_08436, partial [Aspergillus sp. HF37]
GQPGGDRRPYMYGTGNPRGPSPPRGGARMQHVLEGRTHRPTTAGRPRRTGVPLAAIHLPPRKALQGRSARRDPPNALAGGDGLRHTALRWGVRTPRSRRQTAVTAGRLPPGI